MSERILDLDRTVYALCAGDPGIAQILAEAGFPDVARPGMLNTVGRFMTIPKGAAMKGIALEEIKGIFEAHGYKVIGGGDACVGR